MVKRALAVGVNGYGFPNELPNCTRDAESFGNVLETIYRFDEVRILHDGEATRDGVDRGLEWLFQGATGNDRLVLYFSGHGCRVEKSGVLEEALVLQDGRLLSDHDLADRMESLPPGIVTVILDCCFSGLDELLVHPDGQVEVARAKRWIVTDADRGRPERSSTPGAKAYTPFGHVKPAPLEATAAHLRSAGWLDPSPARLVTLAEPQAKALLVMACLGDETTLASTTQTDGLSPFTYCLLNEIKRLGPNRAAIEILQATGHELRRLGLGQTPLAKEPILPEHLGLRAFLTFQPALFVHPPSMPGKGGEEELNRAVAEAVRNTLISMKEGRMMHATMPGTSTGFGEDIGTIVNSVTPIVASILQTRAYQQPFAGAFSSMAPGAPGWSGWPGSQGWGGFGQSGWSGGFGQRGGLEEIAPIVAAVVPAILAGLQNRPYQQYLPGLQPSPQFQTFQPGLSGGGYHPYEVAQLVNTVMPIVASLVQSRSYQGHFGQYLPRAA
jgi:Caspase domain